MEPPTPKEYYDAFRQRLVAARVARKLSQSEMATMLGMSLDSYKKVEIRDRFPLHFVERLALATNLSIEYWITGKNMRPFVAGRAARR